MFQGKLTGAIIAEILQGQHQFNKRGSILEGVTCLNGSIMTMNGVRSRACASTHHSLDVRLSNASVSTPGLLVCNFHVADSC